MKNSPKVGMLLSFVGIWFAYWCPAQFLAYVYDVDKQKMNWAQLLVGIVVASAVYLLGIGISATVRNHWTAIIGFVMEWLGFGIVLGGFLGAFRNSGAWVFSTGMACAVVAGTLWVILTLLWPAINKKLHPSAAQFLLLSAVVVGVNIFLGWSLASKMGFYPFPESAPTFLGEVMTLAWSTAILLWTNKRVEELAPSGSIAAGVGPITFHKAT